ncbi:MAG: hypothetical protein ACK559_05535, partial [bacterium]
MGEAPAPRPPARRGSRLRTRRSTHASRLRGLRRPGGAPAPDTDGAPAALSPAAWIADERLDPRGAPLPPARHPGRPRPGHPRPAAACRARVAGPHRGTL